MDLEKIKFQIRTLEEAYYDFLSWGDKGGARRVKSAIKDLRELMNKKDIKNADRSL